jgi:adenylate cyclase class 2
VATEIEVKIKIEDAADFCRRLQALNPEVLSARHFEDNRLLDFPDGRLSAGQCLLRIRFADGRHFFTFKGPPRPEGIFKIREELETGLEDGEVLLQALERIGMNVSFRYQKFRREFTLGDTHIAVDETPIGNYVEFEGQEAGIRELAQALGIAEAQFLRSSYYSLYVEYCRKTGEVPGFMVFKGRT